MPSSLTLAITRKMIQDRLPKCRIDPTSVGGLHFMVMEGCTPKLGIICAQLPGFMDTTYPGQFLAVPQGLVPHSPGKKTVFLFNESHSHAYSASGADILRSELQDLGGTDYFMLSKGRTKYYDLKFFVKTNFPGAFESGLLE